jgi:hypothetical protein
MGKTLPQELPIDGLNVREKASYCRRLAKAATDTDLAKALLELAEEFEQAAFDSIGPADRVPPNGKKPTRRQRLDEGCSTPAPRPDK